MKNCSNCLVSAGEVTLVLKDGIVEYKMHGYVLIDEDDTVLLQPADLRKNPVMKVPKKNVAKVTVNF